jgi:hypothetical protein
MWDLSCRQLKFNCHPETANETFQVIHPRNAVFILHILNICCDCKIIIEHEPPVGLSHLNVVEIVFAIQIGIADTDENALLAQVRDKGMPLKPQRLLHAAPFVGIDIFLAAQS